VKKSDSRFEETAISLEKNVLYLENLDNKYGKNVAAALLTSA
jgi:hypothetical protein